VSRWIATLQDDGVERTLAALAALPTPGTERRTA